MIARQPAYQISICEAHTMLETKLNGFSLPKLAMITAATFGDIMKHRREH